MNLGVIEGSIAEQNAMKRIALFAAAIATFALMAGCGDGRKEASKTEIDEANIARVKAIDDDPSLTAEQKTAMKARLGGVGTGTAASDPGARATGN